MAQLYLRQLLSGRDFARGDAMAGGMQNFVYLLGDRDAGECVVIDPAWDIAGIIACAEHDGMRITGAMVTHYHPDHVGGSMFGFDIEGLAELTFTDVTLRNVVDGGVCTINGSIETTMLFP